MGESNISSTKKRYAVVTGSNKGIGFEICRQLASAGVMVVVTARDEKKGIEAIDKLNNLGLSDKVVFHQLDVTNPTSVAALADFVQKRFGVLDILVNNAGIVGAEVDWETFRYVRTNGITGEKAAELEKVMKLNDGNPQECLETNYYGAKRMVDSLVGLLQLSDSPRIVNVSSITGQLKKIPSEEVRRVLNNVETLTEEKVDELLSDFLKDFEDGSLEAKGWPAFLPAYIVSKAALNAYTRILAKRYLNFRVNCVGPGYVKTDISGNTGTSTPQEGAQGPVKLALLPDNGPSGLFFEKDEVCSF